MKVLVVGRGGREHAIVHKISQSCKIKEIFCAPGNAGMLEIAKRVNISETDIEKLLEFALINNIDLTIVGPEISLANGIVDLFEKNNLKIFGPTKKATQIESSKAYAKKIMKLKGVQTGKSELFTSSNKAIDYINLMGVPIVIKNDGLAAGKGVVVAFTFEEAYEAVKKMFNCNFDNVSVLVEEYLDGPEFSLMAFVNGKNVYPLEISQDHKRAFDNNKGPNTGGMGAYSNVPFIDDSIINDCVENIMKPVAHGLVEDNNHFTGILYGGIILTKDGPKVIEFNARFGDPETEVVLPRLNNDLIDVIEDVLSNKNPNLEWNDFKTIGVVLASKGYPSNYNKNFVLNGLDDVNIDIYHMGTEIINDKIVSIGGRVLILVAKGKDLSEAKKIVYSEIKKIDSENLFYRNDISYQSTNKE